MPGAQPHLVIALERRPGGVHANVDLLDYLRCGGNSAVVRWVSRHTQVPVHVVVGRLYCASVARSGAVDRCGPVTASMNSRPRLAPKCPRQAGQDNLPRGALGAQLATIRIPPRRVAATVRSTDLLFRQRLPPTTGLPLCPSSRAGSSRACSGNMTPYTDAGERQDKYDAAAQLVGGRIG